jgi:hypothetical protein
MSDQVPDFSKKQMTVTASVFAWQQLVEHAGRASYAYTSEGDAAFNLVQRIEKGLTGNFVVSGPDR